MKNDEHDQCLFLRIKALERLCKVEQEKTTYGKLFFTFSVHWPPKIHSDNGVGKREHVLLR